MLAVPSRLFVIVALLLAAAPPGQAFAFAADPSPPQQRGGRGLQRAAAAATQQQQGDGAATQQVSRVAVGARPMMAALSITDEIELDGILDEAPWQLAERGTGFTQREPFQGEAASEQTFVQVLYTDDTLYIGIRALDSDPAAVIAKDMQRDGSGGGGFRGARLESDDSVSILLDTFHDQRNAFYFETNPLAARVDALITDEGRDRNLEWDGVWDAAAVRTDEGWSAELAIPFNTLRFDPTNDVWGLNVRRMIRRKSEEVNWAPIPRDADMFRVSQYGQLNNMVASDPSRNLRIKPFVTAAGEEGVSTPVGDIDGDAQAGLDMRWGVTDSMTFDLTVNTDFAQVEADEQQVNLTRFSLFFPEKREFFLENAGIFQFATGGGGGGMRGPLLQVYHSRQIGIAEGDEIPIIAGGKLTGRAGDWNVGLLNVTTDEHEFLDDDGTLEGIEPTTNWTVARVNKNLGERSNVGAILTNRQAGGGDWNRVVGLDTTLNPNQNMGINAYFTASDNPGDDRENWAAGGGFNWRGPIWRFSASFDEIREDYDPQVGFLTRSGIRHFNPQITWEPRPGRVGWIRNLSFEARNTLFTRTDGTLETWDGSFRVFGFRTMAEDFVSFSFNPAYERLFEPFEIRDGIVIPVGEYSFHDWSVFANTSDARPVNAFWRFSNGGFYDGNRLNSSITVNYRPIPYLATQTEWSYNDVDLPGGSFSTNVVRQRFNVSFSPNMSLNSFIQYLDTDDLLSMNTRFNWIYRPGADVFIVYNQNWIDGGTQDRALIFKFTYLWAM
jgi:hypothetical protein